MSLGAPRRGVSLDARIDAMAEPDKTSYIRDVWESNLEAEMATIREMVINYPCISMVRTLWGKKPP